MHSLCRLGSLAEPYYLFQKKWYIAEVASMRGGSAPIDPLSMEKPHSRHPMVKRFLADGEQAACVSWLHPAACVA